MRLSIQFPTALTTLLVANRGPRNGHVGRETGNAPIRKITSRRSDNVVSPEPRVCKVTVQHFDVNHSSTQVNAMDEPHTVTTTPILCADSAVWFSAYGFGWGYCAFALPFEVVCEELGARNETVQQVRLAFELNKRRILRTVQQYGAASATGERITLLVADLQRGTPELDYFGA